MYVYDHGKARQRRVEVGHRNSLKAEIIAGLKEKDQVIAHPEDAIREGTEIRPRGK
ncbi:MAG: hypothetical protein U1C55_01725 [Smithellaceae bacterium]|nr:hypothetical protein [Smithellaceae bacterium]